MYYAWRVAICFICARTAQLVCAFNSKVWGLSSVYNRKKVYNSVFTHTLSSHLALGRTRRGPAAETLKNVPGTPATGPRYRDERVNKESDHGPCTTTRDVCVYSRVERGTRVKITHLSKKVNGVHRVT